MYPNERLNSSLRPLPRMFDPHSKTPTLSGENPNADSFSEKNMLAG